METFTEESCQQLYIDVMDRMRKQTTTHSDRKLLSLAILLPAYASVSQLFCSVNPPYIFNVMLSVSLLLKREFKHINSG